MNHANTQARLDQEVTNYVANFGPNMANFQFSMFRNQYYQMYCVTEDTPAQLTTAVPMTQADYLAALRYAKTQAQLNITNNGPGPYFMSQRYDVNTMIPEYWETPYLFMVAPPAHYTRRRKPAGIPANAPAALRYWRDAMGLIYAANGLIDLFMRYFTGNGQVTPPTPTVSVNSSPGISLVGCLAPSPMFAVPPTQAGLSLPAVFPSFSNNEQNLVGASGIARKERGCFIFGGQPYYATFGTYAGNADQTYSKNSMHEFGHTLFLRHHITNAANGNYVGGNFGEDHDNGDRCLMGYIDCEGEYCGKCHLKIRGWDISQMPV